MSRPRSGSGLSKRVALLLSISALGIGPESAPAQNLLVNPEFDEALLISGWTKISGGFFDYTGVDADDCAGSGSGQLPSATTDVGTQWAQVAQCIEIDDANWPDGAHSAFTYISADAEMVYAQNIYYTSFDCGMSGGSLAGIHTQNGAIGPGWHRVAFDDLSIPANALSVWAGLGAERGGTVSFEILIDRAYFGRARRIFNEGTENGSSCRWSVEAP